MNYNEFHELYAQKESAITAQLSRFQKLAKAMAKDMKAGDIKSAREAASQLSETVAVLKEATAAAGETLSQFDQVSFFQNGEFAEAMLALCKEKGIDVIGEFPVYEMFPYRVRIDAENQDVYINKKKYQTIDADYFTDIIRESQEKLDKASFNASSFAAELESAYDTAIAGSAKLSAGNPVNLQSLYKVMVPMARFRKDYDINAYSFDIARLYNNLSSVSLKSGRRVEFGPGRKSDKVIRILDSNGNEQLFSTVAFI